MKTATDTPVRQHAGGHTVVAALVAAAVLSTAGYAAVSARATTAVAGARHVALLGNRGPAERRQLALIPTWQVRIALAASPLSQRLVNVAAVRAIDAGSPAAPWLAQVRRLGWRDTASLQNALVTAVQQDDFPAILDGGDALLRRRELTEQLVPVVMLVELSPSLRERLAQRLAARPNWRAMYLTTFAGLLATPAQVEARAALLGRLAQAGGVARGEAIANVGVFDERGRHDLAFALWRRTQPGVTAPLSDTRFVRAARSFRVGEDRPVAFEWDVLSGEGFSVGASEEGGATQLDIDWDGRGVPVFARQRTSAAPGRYALDVRVADHERADLAALGFRLVCGDTISRFRAAAPGRYVLDEPVRCSFPIMEVMGEVQPSAAAHQVAIQVMVLRPLARAG